MTERDQQSIDHQQAPQQRQFQEVYNTLAGYIETNHLRSMPYTDDMPADDEPAIKYFLPLPADAAAKLFAVPPEIRRKGPGDFKITLITPHRYSSADSFSVSIHFSYRYDFDRSADYVLTGDILPDDSLAWSGTYMHDETDDWEVDDIMRDLTQDDLERLSAIAEAATRLKR